MTYKLFMAFDRNKILLYKLYIAKYIKNSFFTVYIEQDEDGVFVGSIPAVPGCHAEGKTQKEMLKNLQEVLKLCLRNVNVREVEKTRFVGIQNLEVKYA